MGVGIQESIALGNDKGGLAARLPNFVGIHNRCLGAGGDVLAEDGFDLAKVVEVVSGVHGDDGADGFLATLGVHAVLVPQIFGERAVEAEIVVAGGGEGVERGRELALVVAQNLLPGILVEGGDGGAVGRAEDEAGAEADDDFDVGHMHEDLEGRPAAGGRAGAELGVGKSAEERVQAPGRLGKDGERVLPLNKRMDALDVLLDGFGHESSPVCSGSRVRKEDGGCKKLETEG